MEQAIDKVLLERADWLKRRGRRSSWVVSVLLHVGLVVGWIVGPLLAAPDEEPFEFVAVQIVPRQALGVPDPQPPSPARRPTPQPEPEATPPPPEKETRVEEPEPEPTVPAMPAPKAKKRQPKNRPTPNRTPSAGKQGDPGPARRQGSALGSSTGSSAFGATVGGLDNPDFVYGYYVDQMLSMIGSNWIRPALGADVEASVHFRIARDGSISDLRIAKSSGYNSFDLAGLRAVQLAAPLPQLPQSFPHDSLGVNLILR